MRVRQSYSFANEAEALRAFNATEWDGLRSWVAVHGTLYRNTGRTLTDSEGNPYAETEALRGFHVDAVSANGNVEAFPAGNRVYPITPSMGVM